MGSSLELLRHLGDGRKATRRTRREPTGRNLDKTPTRSLVASRVTSGKKAMPSFKNRLTAAEIERLAGFVTGAGR